MSSSAGTRCTSSRMTILACGVAVHEVAKPVGARREALMDLRQQQIDPERVGERLPQKRGLPGAPGAEQKMTGRRRLEKTP